MRFSLEQMTDVTPLLALFVFCMHQAKGSKHSNRVSCRLRDKGMDRLATHARQTAGALPPPLMRCTPPADSPASYPHSQGRAGACCRAHRGTKRSRAACSHNCPPFSLRGDPAAPQHARTSTVHVKTEWERLDSRFILVSPVCLFSAPCRISVITSSTADPGKPHKMVSARLRASKQAFVAAAQAVQGLPCHSTLSSNKCCMQQVLTPRAACLTQQAAQHTQHGEPPEDPQGPCVLLLAMPPALPTSPLNKAAALQRAAF